VTPISLRLCSSALLFVPLSFALIGCRKGEAPAPAPTPKPAPTTLSAADLKKYRPNESGAILVVMYHRIEANEKPSYLNRTPAQFRRDLETMHAQGYYPVNAIDVVNNDMDVPAGKTPIVLTFDDALPSQFRVAPKPDGGERIDPDCAIGIMGAFAKKNKDWPMRATFFVLPKKGRNTDPFGQESTVQQKFKYLVDNGYEIASHTATHSNMRGMTSAQVQSELAIAMAEIKKIAPTAAMQTLALPFGKYPRDKAAKAALLKGSSGGTSYTNKAVFQAAWRPIASPLSLPGKKPSGSISAYDVSNLERVTPGKPGPVEVGTLEYWLAFFKKDPSLRYVSDGNKKIAAIPQEHKDLIDVSKAKAQGKMLQFYNSNGQSSDFVDPSGATSSKNSSGSSGTDSGLTLE
jgi:peptidoglycan/xylan/chitin deacetylase (PgdA/CDA1 family)